MATKLDKDVVRESTVVVDGREIVVTLSAEQKITMKLKGMKSGEVSINILELFSKLSGNLTENSENSAKNGKSVVISNDKPTKGNKNNPMISLHELRTYNAISGLDYPTLVKFEGIIKNLMDNYQEKYGKYPKNDKLNQ
jgi:hypothetical protein